MALPPTLLYRLCEGASEDVYLNLKNENCLVNPEEKEYCIAQIEQLRKTVIEIKENRKGRPMPGPNGFDIFIRLLEDSGLLNERGKQLAATPDPNPYASAVLVMAGFDTAGHSHRITIFDRGASETEGGLVIGSQDALTDVVIPDGTVSRRHARVFVIDGRCQIEDLNSTNGTFVNGRQPAPYERVSIAAGDRVALGVIEFQLNKG